MDAFFRRVLLFVFPICLIFPLYSGEELTFPAAASNTVPDWALGTLYFPKLRVGLDKAGDYANRLVPNSAELAKQIVMNAIFKLPVDAGLKKDGAAQIFMLDSFVTKVNDMAFILPVEDVNAVKTSLLNTFGAPEEDAGTLVFTLPQPLPNPDKKLLIRFIKDRMLVSPDGPVLKKLEEYAEDKATGVALSAISVDALMTIRMQAVRRTVGDMLGMILEMGVAQTAGGNQEQAARLSAQIKSLLVSVWEVETLQIGLDLQAGGEKGTLELKAIPRKGSNLAQIFQKFNSTVNPSLDSLFPPKGALQFKWRMSGAEIAEMLNTNFAPDTGSPLHAAARSAVQAFGDLLKLSNGDAAIGIGTAEQKPVLLVVLGLGDAQKAQPKIKETLEKAISAAQESANAEAKATHRIAPVVRMKEAKIITHGGMTIYEHSMEFEKVTPEEREAMSAVLGTEMAVRYALIDNQIVVALGTGGLSALKSAIENRKAAQPALGANTVIQGSISAVRVVNLFAGVMPVTVAATRGLSDAEITLALQQTDGALALRIGIPADAALSIMEIPKRLRRANIHLGDILKEFDAGDAPAPAPAP